MIKAFGGTKLNTVSPIKNQANKTPTDEITTILLKTNELCSHT